MEIVEISALEFTLGVGRPYDGGFMWLEKTNENYKVMMTPSMDSNQDHIEVGHLFTDFLKRMVKSEE